MMSIHSAQAIGELKRLSNRTVSAAGVASQGSLNRQQMVELLQFATGNSPSKAHSFNFFPFLPSSYPRCSRRILAFPENACASGVYKRLILCD